MVVARLLIASVLLAGCSVFEGEDADGGALDAPPVTAGEGTVIIQGIAYNPARVEVAAGEELVWSFDDNGLDHTVTADDGSFDSGRQATGEFRQTFTTPGEITYHCEVHATMNGTVVVR